MAVISYLYDKIVMTTMHLCMIGIVEFKAKQQNIIIQLIILNILCFFLF